MKPMPWGTALGQHRAFYTPVEPMVPDLVGGQVAGALAHVHHRGEKLDTP